MTRYAAIYARLSPRPDGSYEGVDAQVKLGRDYCASAWPDLPVEVFADRGISAANGDHRPEYERLREWLADGRIARVWTVEQTRLQRNEIAWFTLAAELDAAGITEVHTNRDGIVRVRDDVAGIKAVLAAGEVRRIRQRINDGLAAKVAAGIPPGGGIRFGYRNVVRKIDGAPTKTLVIVPGEAEIIRFAAQKVLDGWGLNAILAEVQPRIATLRASGVEGTLRGKLGSNSIRSWLVSPTVAGHRVHQGRIAARGNWEPILDEDTWQAVKAKLAQPRRVRRADGGEADISAKFFGHSSARKYLITGGIAVCGVCGAHLSGNSKRIGGRLVPYLECRKTNGGRNCVGILLEPSEEVVVDLLWEKLGDGAFLDAVMADDHAERRAEITAKLGRLDNRRNELAETWATGELTPTEWATARRALAEHEQALRAELTAIPAVALTPDMVTAARESWPEMTLDERREFMRQFIDRVSIRRGVRGRRGIDPSRIAVTWAA